MYINASENIKLEKSFFTRLIYLTIMLSTVKMIITNMSTTKSATDFNSLPERKSPILSQDISIGDHFTGHMSVQERC